MPQFSLAAKFPYMRLGACEDLSNRLHREGALTHPSRPISTRATERSAASTARIAAVTSRRRNVRAARGISSYFRARWAFR